MEGREAKAVIHYALFSRVGHRSASSATARFQIFMMLWVATQNRLHSRERHPTLSCHKVHYNCTESETTTPSKGGNPGLLNTVFGSFCSEIAAKPGRDSLMESAKEFLFHGAGEMMELMFYTGLFAYDSHLLCL